MFRNKFRSILALAAIGFAFVSADALATYCPNGQQWDYDKKKCVTPPPKTCPNGQVGTPPNCTTPPPPTCPTGQTGTPPNCTTPPTNPPGSSNSNTNTNNNANNNSNTNNNSSNSSANAGAAAGAWSGSASNATGGNSTATGGNATGGHSTATGGAGGSVNGSGNSSSISQGGAGGQGGQGGAGGSVGNTTSSSGVVGSGNSTSDNRNNLTNTGGNSSNTNNLGQGQGQSQSNDHSGNSTNVLGQNLSGSGNATLGDVGSNSSSTVGNVGSNSGGNTLSNGSNSTSGVGDTSSNSTSSSGGNTMTGGDNTNANAASADGSGNSTVNIDASDRRGGDVYESQTLFVPSVQVAPPSIVAGANVVVDRGVCGPRQGLVTEDVQGIYIGMFSQRHVYLGKTDRLVSIDGAKFLLDRGPDGVERLIGHRPVNYIAALGVAGSRSIGLGGGETGGNWANGGASGSSSMQRMVVQTNLEDCEYAHRKLPPPPVSYIQERVPARIGQ